MKKIKVGLGTCGISAGGELVFNKLDEEIKKRNLDVELTETGCMGMCYEEPMIEIEDNGDSYLYSKFTTDKVDRILDEHIVNNHPVEEWIIRSSEVSKEANFLDNQNRIVLRNCGVINPSSIEDYLLQKGYEAIKDVLKNKTPQEVIDMIKDSGLRGRGGGGFQPG